MNQLDPTPPISHTPPATQETLERFTALAHRYDLGNTLLTLGLHKMWKRSLIRRIDPAVTRVLDVASGTGDLALMALGRCPRAEVYATDITVEMLRLARLKLDAQDDRLKVEEADMTALPYDDKSFSVSTVAFGLRNVSDLRGALRELGRVTRKQILILETGNAGDAISAKFYSLQRQWTRTVGKLLGQREHYEYLARSTEGFPSGEGFAALLSSAFPQAWVSHRKMGPFPVFLYEVRF